MWRVGLHNFTLHIYIRCETEIRKFASKDCSEMNVCFLKFKVVKNMQFHKDTSMRKVKTFF